MLAERICPNCGSKNSAVPMKGDKGKFVCSVCGYSGRFTDKKVIGREMEVEDDE